MKLKRIAALVLCLALALSLGGCVGNFYEYVGTINDTDITAGLYRMAMNSAFTEASQKVEDSEKDVLKQQIEGQGASKWIEARTETILREYVAVRALCRENEVVLDTQAEENLSQGNSYWTYLETRYNANGVGYTSFERYNRNSELKRALFTKLAAEGGALYTSDEELKAEYTEKYAHMRAISVPVNALEEGVDVKDEVTAMASELVGVLESGKTLEEITQEDLPAIYEKLGRDYDVSTGSDNIYDTYIQYEPESFEVYSEDFLQKLKSQSVGEYGSYSLGSTIIVYELVPTFQNDAEFETNRAKVLSDLKSTEYNDYLAAIYNEYPVSWKLGARFYFRPADMEQ